MSDDESAPPPIDPAAAELHLAPLASKLMQAIALREEGKHDAARALLHEILQADPRLAEPRLELAHLAALRADWEEAEAQAREAVELLHHGGQWTADIAGPALLSFAVNLLGEIVYRALQDGDLIFLDRAAFDARWNEAAGLFVEALRLDPTNEDARYWTGHIRHREVPDA